MLFYTVTVFLFWVSTIQPEAFNIMNFDNFLKYRSIFEPEEVSGKTVFIAKNFHVHIACTCVFI